MAKSHRHDALRDKLLRTVEAEHGGLDIRSQLSALLSAAARLAVMHGKQPMLTEVLRIAHDTLRDMQPPKIKLKGK